MSNHLARFSARVVHGNGRGRALDFPTANLDAVPNGVNEGIYAAWIRIEGEEHWREATVSFGNNPTFGDLDNARVECFLHNFEGNLYGRQIETALVALIRTMQTFTNTEEMVVQAHKDVTESLRLLQMTSVPIFR